MTSDKTAISLISEYTLTNKEIKYGGGEDARSYMRTLQSKRTVQIVLSYSAGTVVAQMDDVSVEPSVVTELMALAPNEGEKLTAGTRDAVFGALREISGAVRDLLSLIKYHLRHDDISEQFYSPRVQRWRVGTAEWRAVPNSYSATISGGSVQPLEDRVHDSIQAALTAERLPLVAMRHLHRAKHERLPHYRWIDATIAAELAIKEVLSRKCPEIEFLLLELQSPPLSKLYGDVMKNYLGEASPYVEDLAQGSNKRNKLVHSHNADPISHEKANAYVALVEAAIFHLLCLLYPDDELIRQASHRTHHFEQQKKQPKNKRITKRQPQRPLRNKA